LLVVLRRARARHFIDDALQDLWLNLLTAPPSAEVAVDHDRLFAWLSGAARRRLVDLIRRESRRRQVPLADAPDAAVPSREREENALRVRAVLAELSASGSSSVARLLELRYIEERSVAEIGRELKLSPRVVSARLQRAKRKFREVWLLRGGGRMLTEWTWSISRFFRVTFSPSERLTFWSDHHRRIAMKRFPGALLLLCAVVCIMGASTITYDAGQPAPNPGGKASSLDAKGTYALDPNEVLVDVVHIAYETKLKQATAKGANAANGKWDCNMSLVAGNYDCEGKLTTRNAQMQFFTAYTGTVNVTVK
jgi:RNA polymerase sigma factor (sigma-70 family)